MKGSIIDVLLQSFVLSWSCALIAWVMEDLLTTWIIRLYRDYGHKSLRLEDGAGINPLFGEASDDTRIMRPRFSGFMLGLTTVGWIVWFLSHIEEGEPIVYEFIVGLVICVPVPSFARLILGLLFIRNLPAGDMVRGSLLVPTWILLQMAAAAQLMGSLIWFVAWFGSGRWFFVGAFTGSLAMGLTHLWSAFQRTPRIFSDRVD